MNKKSNISMSVIRRLPRYYRFLKELKRQGVLRISSRELSKKMNITASQIRQDFNCFGEFGLQGYGYNVELLYAEICNILGISSNFSAILIGAGNLGKAIATHMDFESNGFELIGIFDQNPDSIGKKMVGLEILSMEGLESFCEKKKPLVAIFCIPPNDVISLSEILIEHGVKGFWNFAHIDFAQNIQGIVIENVHLSDSMMTLCYRLNELMSTEEKGA